MAIKCCVQRRKFKQFNNINIFYLMLHQWSLWWYFLLDIIILSFIKELFNKSCTQIPKKKNKVEKRRMLLHTACVVLFTPQEALTVQPVKKNPDTITSEGKISPVAFKTQLHHDSSYWYRQHIFQTVMFSYCIQNAKQITKIML